MTLKDLHEGQTATITGMIGDSAFNKRLTEMGFLEGTEIYIEKYAPLRDPIELVIKGYHLSLRKKDAELIEVDPVTMIRRRQRRRGKW